MSSGRVHVAILFGGRSSEHSISCVSAAGVLRALDPERYAARSIGISRDGRWVDLTAEIADSGVEMLQIDGSRLPEIAAVPGSAVEPTSLLDGIDVVFPVLHGPWGEDGTVQGLLELAGLPYVGSGVLSSAASMDKQVMKALLQHAGLPVGRYLAVTDRDWRHDRDRILVEAAELGLPVFVKPARAGSSVGVSMVRTAEDLPAAIEEARQHDPKVIIEAAFLGAREIECAVLSDRDGTPMASICAEIVVGAGHDFYDFEAKYLDDAAELIVPASLDAATSDRVRAMAVEAFNALGCEGLARIDFFVDAAGSVWVNEANTMPGFTPISMFPRMWAETGIGYVELVDRLIQDALRRGVGLR